MNCCGFSLPALPLLTVHGLKVSIGLQCRQVIFPLNSFQRDSVRWQLPAVVVPACRVAMDTSLLCSGPLSTYKEPVPKLNLLARSLTSIQGTLTYSNPLISWTIFSTNVYFKCLQSEIIEIWVANNLKKLPFLENIWSIKSIHLLKTHLWITVVG